MAATWETGREDYILRLECTYYEGFRLRVGLSQAPYCQNINTAIFDLITLIAPSLTFPYFDSSRTNNKPDRMVPLSQTSSLELKPVSLDL